MFGGCIYGGRADISALYVGAGLRDVVEWDVGVELVTESPEQYWEMISGHVSLAVAALQQVDEPARKWIRANAIATVSAFENDGKVRVPGVVRCGASWERNRMRAARAPADTRDPPTRAVPTQPSAEGAPYLRISRTPQGVCDCDSGSAAGGSAIEASDVRPETLGLLAVGLGALLLLLRRATRPR